jgi:hypothetical protein
VSVLHIAKCKLFGTPHSKTQNAKHEKMKLSIRSSTPHRPKSDVPMPRCAAVEGRGCQVARAMRTAMAQMPLFMHTLLNAATALPGEPRDHVGGPCNCCQASIASQCPLGDTLTCAWGRRWRGPKPECRSSDAHQASHGTRGDPWGMLTAQEWRRGPSGAHSSHASALVALVCRLRPLHARPRQLKEAPCRWHHRQRREVTRFADFCVFAVLRFPF